MSEVGLTCPYCNTLLAAGAVGSSMRGPSCPRCGEALPANLAPRGLALAEEPPAPAPAGVRRSNQMVGLLILLVMVAVGAVGLGFALKTQEFRRGNDIKIAQVGPQTVQTAGDWAGLGFLPSECNLLAGIHAGRLRQDADGNKLLAESRPLQLAAEHLEKWTGLRLEDMEQIVAGVNVDGQIPQLTVVVHTRQPFNPAGLARVLKADKTVDVHGKPAFAFKLGQVGEGRLWCPGDQALVVLLAPALQNADLDRLPLPPRPGSEGLLEPLQDLLKRRLGGEPAAWLAGHGDWQNSPLVSFIPKDKLAVLPAEARDLKVLEKVKTFGLGLETNPPRLTGNFLAGDQPKAAALKKFFDDWTIAALRVEVTEGDWVTVQKKLLP